MPASFEILPAIDLRDSRVVRLEQGDYDRETAFSDDPIAVAERFAGEGAHWIHVVDLDGARAGRPVHAALIERIVRAVGERVSVEVAGGLRTDADVAMVLETGAARAVVGTAALRDPAFAGRLVARHGPDRIVAAIDVRDGIALGEAWRPGAAGLETVSAVAILADEGVEIFEVTAIERDGLLGGPDPELLGRLVALGRGSVVASGGVTTLADLATVRGLGCVGAIVGRALYERRLDLREAIAWSAATTPHFRNTDDS
ncbi:MAG: 1-(5-phosphoribosyl)-5-[(5-phosphoribosylamino)methylideneamino] imidazole-4-carboxamide isomerase [Chloroflexi bacterium]|nr:1-(5-phosphoribosyl)-5-[(5-phosphoribosylamino)methylideneamino] imidazole-4-carboxamide isomerase [Chloroflexota bacterium]